MDAQRDILNGIEIDGQVSVQSRRALQLAARIARRRGARLTLLHCVKTGKLPDAERTRLEDVLDKLASEIVPEGVPVTTRITSGTPWKELTRTALALAAELVIVGRSARRPETSGTPLDLLKRCPGDVWVVHPQVAPIPTCVLAASDLGAVGDRAVEVGRQVAEGFDADLHVLHAYSTPPHVELARDALEARRELEQIERGAREHLAERAGKTARIHVLHDTPSRAIMSAIDALGIDLLVTGTVSRTGLARWLVGSTAARLLNKVSCSVLAVKPEDFPVPEKLASGAATQHDGE
jgi:nucleotide-binding universal stress UspA family protein